MQLDWSKLDLVVFAKDATTAKGLVCLPEDNKLVEIALAKAGNNFKISSDPLGGKAAFTIRPPVAH
jgi:alpha-D-xyloside xylohydrolase